MKGGVFGEKCPRDVLLGSDSLILHENYSLGARKGSKKLENGKQNRAAEMNSPAAERKESGGRSRRARQ